MATIAVGIGSNIDPARHMAAAADMLRECVANARFSRVYRSAPLLLRAQDPFLNAVMTGTVSLSPEETMTALRHIETTLKKNPPQRYGPRTIDLDLLLYDTQVRDTPEITLPHPRMRERRFVLEPLLECLPADATDPQSGGKWADFLAEVRDQHCEPTDIVL